ncbi:NACHT domain-containing protein [Candidatus Desantisbacteria bacterium]|nr:NACHT domain-containing protein [Candidatus Desantisbacteria bacterium]
MQDLLWWTSLNEGEKYLLSFLFIDRVGSTKDSEYYSKELVGTRANLFYKIVEDKIISFNGKLLEWHGDGNTAFFYVSKPESLQEQAEILSKKAVDVALSIFSELVQHEELKAYISIHFGLLSFKKEMGKISSDELNIAGHVLKSCPEAGILLHEDVISYSPDDTKQKFIYCGTTQRDLAPVFVYPKQRETLKKIDEFLPPDKDNYNAKNKHIKFTKEFYGKIIPRGLRQEKIVRIDLLDIYSPLKIRLQQKESLINFNDKKDLPSPYSKIETLSYLMSVPETIIESRHSVILGSPGAGKSTLIKWLALIYAQGKISVMERIGIEEELFPLPISIGHLSKIWIDNNKQIGMMDAIIKYYEIHNINISVFIKEIIETGKTIILFDGLDEVQSDADRRELSRWIESFITAFHKNRFVITSRIVGYTGISLANIDFFYIILKLIF